MSSNLLPFSVNFNFGEKVGRVPNVESKEVPLLARNFFTDKA
jgi:hypothetical protein